MQSFDLEQQQQHRLTSPPPVAANNNTAATPSHHHGTNDIAGSSSESSSASTSVILVPHLPFPWALLLAILKRLPDPRKRFVVDRLPKKTLLGQVSMDPKACAKWLVLISVVYMIIAGLFVGLGWWALLVLFLLLWRLGKPSTFTCAQRHTLKNLVNQCLKLRGVSYGLVSFAFLPVALNVLLLMMFTTM